MCDEDCAKDRSRAGIQIQTVSKIFVVPANPKLITGGRSVPQVRLTYLGHVVLRGDYDLERA